MNKIIGTIYYGFDPVVTLFNIISSTNPALYVDEAFWESICDSKANSLVK
jgi:hypothetical protein